VESNSVGTLVRAAAVGDDDAWTGLVARFAGVIWAVARSHGLSNADAADVSQTTWLKLAEHVHRIREPDRVGAWLTTTARNESIRILRRGHRDIPMGAGCDIPMDEDPSDAAKRLLDEERDVSLMKAFEALPSRCKLLLRVLIAAQAPSYAEASVVLEMPIGSIGPTRARCLQHLRRGSGLAPDGRERAEPTTTRRPPS
jgi:RNA polymerase sigma factor (sigma-70 family)